MCGKTFRTGPVPTNGVYCWLLKTEAGTAYHLEVIMPNQWTVRPASEQKRLLRHIDKGKSCWKWKGTSDACGYGRFWLRKNKWEQAHRSAYRILRGPIPEGMTLDHLCRNRWCVNPDHLEAVTIEVNVMRGEGVCVKNRNKTHCFRGHEFTLANTKVYRGRRICIACDKLRMRAITAKRRLSNKKRIFLIDAEGKYTCIRFER